MRRITIRLRLILLVALCLLFAAGIGFTLYGEVIEIEYMAADNLEENAMQGQRDKLKATASTMAEALGVLAGDDSGKLREAVADARYEDDNSGYFFIARGTTVVTHAATPRLEGRDMSDVTDPNGVHVYDELVEAAESGGGFVNYIWDKPGEGEQPKLAYATMIPGTDLWLSTGVYVDDVEATVSSMVTEMDGHIDATMLLVSLIVAGALLLVVIPLCVLVLRSIIGPLDRAGEVAERIAEGDLDMELDPNGKDEITSLVTTLKHMVSTLRDNLREIDRQKAEAADKAESAERMAAEAEEKSKAEEAKSRQLLQAAEQLDEAVERLSSASEEISAQTEQIKAGADDQKDRMAETATSMEQMNSTVLEVASNASSAAERSQESRQKADDGQDIVRESMESMRELDRIATDLRENMGSLGQKADDIGRVIDVINDIADQTNLLALNAAIEAARAGDAGKGFAVVADEVRKLAEKTMDATKEVGQVIQGIQDVSKTNMDSVERAGEAVRGAVDLAGRSESSLSEIVTMAEEAANQVSSIATAAEEQSAASEQINGSVSEVNRIAEENATAIQQTGQAIQDMVALATEMRGLVGQLKDQSDHA
jgi:methyl-accepting chemotaxis protein